MAFLRTVLSMALWCGCMVVADAEKMSFTGGDGTQWFQCSAGYRASGWNTYLSEDSSHEKNEEACWTKVQGYAYGFYFSHTNYCKAIISLEALLSGGEFLDAYPDSQDTIRLCVKTAAPAPTPGPTQAPTPARIMSFTGGDGTQWLECSVGWRQSDAFSYLSKDHSQEVDEEACWKTVQGYAYGFYFSHPYCIAIISLEALLSGGEFLDAYPDNQDTIRLCVKTAAPAPTPARTPTQTSGRQHRRALAWWTKRFFGRKASPKGKKFMTGFLHDTCFATCSAEAKRFAMIIDAGADCPIEVSTKRSARIFGRLAKKRRSLCGAASVKVCGYCLHVSSAPVTVEDLEESVLVPPTPCNYSSAGVSSTACMSSRRLLSI